mgnify:CR=1 FL=1
MGFVFHLGIGVLEKLLMRKQNARFSSVLGNDVKKF